MWKERLMQLHNDFPGEVKLYNPALPIQIAQVESVLKLKLGELDPGWKEFLLLTNGANILNNVFLSATLKPDGVAKVNSELWDIDDYKWLRNNFVIFLERGFPSPVGFVREQSRSRCIGFLGELEDNEVLPIASSFETFMDHFLEEVEFTLKKGALQFEIGKIPNLPEGWVMNLSAWCLKDSKLKAMLKEGALDDLFKDNEEYSDIVEKILKNPGK